MLFRGDILQYIAWKFLVFIYNQRLHPNLRPLGAVEVGLVVSSPTIVINRPRTLEKLHCKEEQNRFSGYTPTVRYTHI